MPRRVRRGMGLLVRSTAFSFSDPVFSAVQRNAYPELFLAVGSIPYSSLAPPTTDERVAVTDSISIATAGLKENFLRVVFPWNLDILININKIKVSSRPRPNEWTSSPEWTTLPCFWIFYWEFQGIEWFFSASDFSSISAYPKSCQSPGS